MYEQSDIWFIETSQGVFHVPGKEVEHLIRSGQISPNHRLRRPNGAWCEAARTFEFGSLFPPVPPPQPSVPRPRRPPVQWSLLSGKGIPKPVRKFLSDLNARLNPRMVLTGLTLALVLGVMVMGLAEGASDLTQTKAFAKVRLVETSVVVVGFALSIFGMFLSYRKQSIIHLACGMVMFATLFGGYKSLNRDLVAAYVPDKKEMVTVPARREYDRSGYSRMIPETRQEIVTPGYDPKVGPAWFLLFIGSGILTVLGMVTLVHAHLLPPPSNAPPATVEEFIAAMK